MDIDKSEHQKPSKSSEPCERCAGTGLVCGVTPVIDSKNCCVDYANAVCPQCKGSGVSLCSRLP